MVFIVAAIASAVIVLLVRRVAVLDIPNERSSHTRPTPRGGGIGIAVVSIAGMLYARMPPVLIACGVVIAVVSWIDDVRGLSSAIRFPVHLAVAAATAIAIGPWRALELPHVMAIPLGAFGWVITVLWIGGLTNAYNFMDGIDGIAALQAVVAGGGWVLLGSMLGDPMLTTAGLVVAGGSLGFLVQNWQPASIFMGDVGAAFLGYLFAALAVLAAAHHPHTGVTGCLLVWPFVFDTTFTFVRRALRRERLHQAHRSHLYQRLNQTGVSHATVSSLYGALAVLGVIVAATVLTGRGAVVGLAAIVVAIIMLVVLVHARERATRAANNS